MGTQPLVIIDVATTCGCASPTFDKHPASPGEELKPKANTLRCYRRQQVRLRFNTFFVLFIIVLLCNACRQPERTKKVERVKVKQVVLFLLKTLLICLILGLPGCGFQQLKYPFSEVMAHYSAPGDSLKRRATEYLARYACFHYGVPNEMVDTNHVAVNDFCGYKTYSSEAESIEAFKKKGYSFRKGNPIPDIEVLTPEYLIENIDLAFKAWESPLAQHIDFDLFCETLLPYRVQTEPLSNWRSYLSEKYAWVLDSLVDKSDTHQLSRDLINAARREIGLSTLQLPYKGFLTPQGIENIGYGTCIEDAQYFTMVLRAMGVPSAYTSSRLTRLSVEHGDNVIFCRDTAFYIGLYEDREFPVLPGYYNGVDLSRVVRKTYALSDKKAYQMLLSNNFPYTIDLFSVDMSQLCYTDTLRYILPDSVRNEKYAYLCIFHRWNWLAIRYSRIEKDGSVTFPNTVINRLYVVGVYKEGKNVAVTLPEVFYGDNDFEPRIATDKRHHQIQLSYPYKEDKVVSKRISTNFLNSKNHWEPIEGEAHLYIMNPKTRLLEPSEDLTTPGLERRYVLTLKDIPRYTVFYDDNLYLLRLWGIGRDELCTAY